MPAKKYCYEFPRPAVTVDIVVLTSDVRPRVLLIRRKHAPFAGMWAIPGGFVDMDESLADAARRELREETGVAGKRLEQLGTFGAPGRDPRGRTISVVYLTRVDADQVQPRAADDAEEAAWHDLARLPRLAFDHRDILKLARKRLRQSASRIA
ncbi:MAG: NUDIX hydrolase [Planctomycetes bacterium]|nr:NUDIX hydrolase [Planctomycetota bacterium]